ncbi:glycosyltransferase [Pseudobacteroides cellulosolvens]|uniref:Glycosyl transferase group 1 n=1 Tax=Pseudobacteroides cellulosolvens ATCC 35603 = DSM 2933 TaxID=398512 RepID=A0A0L6JM53_9FIRM|nr:glycosyltransferase [Pseudobacteroides cellulosolvens]KNY26833.1 hypothetical protein Bccel_2098 [Pseudobacteroides cellulosolvens ATCC 35603 = DSM 2933]
MFRQYESFTFFPAQQWSHTWERQHELIYRFAKEIDREINIFSPLGLVSYNFFSKEFFNKVLERHKKKVSTNNRNAVHPNMKFIDSLYIHRFDLISSVMNYKLLKRKIKLSDNNFFWSTYINPTIYRFFKKSKFKIIDLAERRQSNMKISSQMRQLEKQAVSEADVVIVDNMATYDDYKTSAKKIFYIPQGYDHNLIKAKEDKSSNVPTKIGYIGNLHYCIDYDYLFKLIEINQHLEFVIVGGIVDKTAEKLFNYSNVQMIGQVPKSELPKYLKQIDYGLIPYKINEFTKGVNPTKLFEYLGAGVPVISTPIPEVKRYKNDKFIFIESEAKLIDYKLNFENIDQLLAGNTWDKRFNLYLKHIGEIVG